MLPSSSTAYWISIGLQQTSQSSIYVWRRTDVSNTIEISFQQYGQVKKYSISRGRAAGARSGYRLFPIAGQQTHYDEDSPAPEFVQEPAPGSLASDPVDFVRNAPWLSLHRP